MTDVTVMHKMISYGYWDLATDTPTRQYRIIISGHLGAVGREAFRDFRIEPHGTDTALAGELNRSGLFDTLARLRDLGLDLVGLACLAPWPDAGQQTDSLEQPLRISSRL